MDLVSSQHRGEIPVLYFSDNEKQTQIARTYDGGSIKAFVGAEYRTNATGDSWEMLGVLPEEATWVCIGKRCAWASFRLQC
jgi:hypothetical protein